MFRKIIGSVRKMLAERHFTQRTLWNFIHAFQRKLWYFHKILLKSNIHRSHHEVVKVNNMGKCYTQLSNVWNIFFFCFREKNVKLSEALHRLESDPQCQSLSLHSFLMLPMQRITRLPLLVDAMLTKMNPVDYSTEYHMCEMTLASLNAVSAMRSFRFHNVCYA